jgi:chemotaxis protein methyltransferase CheR
VSETEAVLPALSREVGIELGAYRREHVLARVKRALEHERLASVDELLQLVRTSRAARSRFRRSVAVSVSGLFRDRDQFNLLEAELLPPLLARGGRLRVWSAGCADGSELYSVALLLERLGGLDRSYLLGSDLLDENIRAARAGVYGDVVVPPTVKGRVRWELRDLVSEGAPPGTYDLVLCRNLAIYLAPGAKEALHRVLAGALAPGGVLLLGRAERLTDPGTLGVSRAGPHAYRRDGS